MPKIGILSDTHGIIDASLFTFFADCEEIWHAGDWGTAETVKQLENFKPIRAVYGNIDGQDVRLIYPEVNEFTYQGIQVCILHIGGYPEKYSPLFKKILKSSKPDLVICGHSHVLKVMRDKKNNLMHINPGAAGNHGFHQIRTAIRLNISEGKLSDLEVWEKKR
jgi:putative phosphoesterase